MKNRAARITTMAAAGAAAAAGLGMATAGDAHADTGVWDRVAQCESGGNWSINTGNGYYGGLQFTLQTWRGFGGTGMPQNASKAEQIRVAQRVLAGQGPGAWPVCSVRAGLTRASGGASSYTPTQQAQQPQTSRSTTRQAPKVQTPKRQVQQAPKAAAPKVAAPKKQVQQAPTGKVKQHKHQSYRAVPKAQTTGETLTVKSGDTLSKLAEKLGLKHWNSLFQANTDKISNPNLIFVGQVLDIPAA
nr:transglycosylase family protein [Yimella sp. cx-51]